MSPTLVWAAVVALLIVCTTGVLIAAIIKAPLDKTTQQQKEPTHDRHQP